jgi:hypothetical protein
LLPIDGPRPRSGPCQGIRVDQHRGSVNREKAPARVGKPFRPPGPSNEKGLWVEDSRGRVFPCRTPGFRFWCRPWASGGPVPGRRLQAPGGGGQRPCPPGKGNSSGARAFPPARNACPTSLPWEALLVSLQKKGPRGHPGLFHAGNGGPLPFRPVQCPDEAGGQGRRGWKIQPFFPSPPPTAMPVSAPGWPCGPGRPSSSTTPWRKSTAPFWPWPGTGRKPWKPTSRWAAYLSMPWKRLLARA